LQKDINELKEAGIISGDTAEAISRFYENRKSQAPNRLVTVFAVLGASLIGLGIILILAHNWDELGRGVKTLFCFLPLLAGQVACAYTLLRKAESTAWRESSSAFLFLSIGASISLVAQVYHLSGDFSNFMLTWVLLGLPLVYLLKASFTALLYLCGISVFAGSAGYSPAFNSQAQLYWLLLAAILPHCAQLVRQAPEGGFTKAFAWFLAISLSTSLVAVSHVHEELLLTAYMNLFALLFLFSTPGMPAAHNASGFRVIGLLGMVVLLILTSFKDFWEGIRTKIYDFAFVGLEPGFLAGLCFGILALVLLRRMLKSQKLSELSPFSWVFIAFTGVYYFGCYPKLAAVLINLLTLSVGILTVVRGTRQNHLGILNFGLATISALVICRFFDTDLSFVVRGVLFVSLGLGFFAANYQLLKKRKTA